MAATHRRHVHLPLQAGLGIWRRSRAHSRVPKHLPNRHAHAPGRLPLVGEGIVGEAILGQRLLHEVVQRWGLAVRVERKGPAVGPHHRAGWHAVAPRGMHVAAYSRRSSGASRVHSCLLW